MTIPLRVKRTVLHKRKGRIILKIRKPRPVVKAVSPVHAPHTVKGRIVLDSTHHDPAKQLELKGLCLRVVTLAQAIKERQFYAYQVEVAYRICESLLSHDSEVITCLMARQMGKCLKKGTKVMLASGQIVNVESIAVGDELMGDDKSPRKVLEVTSGTDTLYTVTPVGNYAEPYTVNSAHILTLLRRGRRGAPDEVVDIAIKDFLALPPSTQSRYMGLKAEVDFPERETLLDPYWFGLWLGDGSSHGPSITTGDNEVVSEIFRYAFALGERVSKYSEKGNCSSYAIVGTGLIQGRLRSHAVLGRKHIPMQYLANSRKVRMELLAGLIDSDGFKHSDTNYQIVQTNEQLAKEIQHLARSLGFRASLRVKPTTCQTGAEGSCFVVHIYGKIWEIPVRVERKRATPVTLRENPLTYGFTLKKEARGEYFGFVIDGNKRFLLGDFTVTHNTELIGAIVAAILIILPSLARQYPDDWHLNITDENGVYRGFMLGVHIGIYAPRMDQSAIMFERVKHSLETDTAKKVLGELRIALEVSNGNCVRLSNGSSVLCQSASEQSKIEGATHHLLIAEEAQEISDLKMKKSLHPMVSATGGTIVKVGTATTTKCDFYTAIKHNERTQLVTGLRNHFFYPYTVGMQFNSLYKKVVEREKVRLGEASDEFRTSYCGEWIFERGMFATLEQLFNRDIAQENGIWSSRYATGAFDARNHSVVAGIDWGSSSDSTVVTALAVDWTTPLESARGFTLQGGSYSYTYYPKHVIDWLEFVGDNYEIQFWNVINYLKGIKGLKKVVTDSNTCGKPIYDRLAATLAGSGIDVVEFNFQPKIKSDGYKSLYSDICGRRITFPAGAGHRNSNYLRFVQQMLDLRKTYKSGLMQVAHPEEKDAHDDYPDSLMMAAWGANDATDGNGVDFSGKNPFYSA